MTKKTNDTDPLREQLQPLIDFILEFDEETQELWMRYFELHAQPVRTEQETEEFEILLSKLKLADAERSSDPVLKVTLVAEEVAYRDAFKKAKQAGLSRLGVHIAAVTAESKARGETPSEAEEFVGHVFLGAPSAHGLGPLNSRHILEAFDEVKRAGLWPWKGVN